jgi:serine/threonine protein kinase/TolB-like protein
MDQERWPQVKEILDAAIQRPTNERTAFLSAACSGDEALYHEVESLLDSYESGFLEQPAVGEFVETPESAQPQVTAGQSIGHYRIVSLLGRGGMGEVYLSEDTRLARKVALKFLPAEVATNQERMRRFVLEARAAATLNYPNIAHIYEIGEADNLTFIAMEYIDGQTLLEQIHRDKVPLVRLLGYLTQVAEGLVKAHAAGIVHRDLKPDNIMITRDGYAKILDFGLAKLTEPRKPSATSAVPASEAATAAMPQHSTPGVVMGTVGYMSPEQARGQIVDERSDIFSFGCILFEAATGRQPFAGDSAIDSLHKLIYEQAPPIRDIHAAAPAELQRIICGCLMKEPEKRYQTIRDVANDLEDLRREMEREAEPLRFAPPAPSDAAAATGERQADTEITRWPATQTAKLSATQLLVVCIAIAGLAVALSYLWITAKPKPSSEGAAIRSLAVLPFKPVVAAERDPVYELGLANSLIFTFSSIKQLNVRPIESIRKYMDLDLDPPAAGRELGVDFVLASHYQKSGDQIRVTSQMINVHDGSTFETFKCDEKCTNIFETQDAISLKVGQQLLAKLTDEQRRLLTKRYTDNREAYDLYLKGWNSWSKFTEESLKEGVKYFEQALAKDPKYALAYHGLTGCRLVLGILYLDPREEMPKAKVAATKARELDDTLAETHTSLGGVAFFYDWDWETAEREFKRAIELDPYLVRSHHWYGDYLSAMERHNEAIAEMNRAEELTGVFTTFRSSVTRMLFQAGRYDEAIERCNKYPEPNVGETHRILGLSYWKKGMRDLAIEALDRANTFSGALPRTAGPLGYVCAMSGKKDKAKKLLEELQQRSKQKYVSSYYIAQISTVPTLTRSIRVGC